MAKTHTDVEVVVGREALPGLDVDDGRFTPREATRIFLSYRLQHSHSKSATSIVGELPLVLKAAGAIDGFERGDAHDEIVDKGEGNVNEPSVSIVIPLRVDHIVFLGTFDVVGVEHDHAEVQLGHVALDLDGRVEQVVRLVQDGGVDVEADGVGWGTNACGHTPVAGDEKHEDVGGERLGERVK